MSKFWHNFPEISKDFQINFGQGDTPIKKISIYDSQILIKNELANPNMSFKDRGVSYQIARHMQEGNNEYAISSSGNAAITATYIAKQYEIKLTIFLSENINNEKLKKIATFANESKNITIIKSKKPRSDLFKFIFDNRCINLRGSTDKYAQVGYESIATELVESGEDFDSIFIPASSGVSSIGVYNGFMKLGKKVQIHVCQTEKVNAIAKHFDFDFEIHNNSKADAITDKVGLRKREIIEIINTSKGFGWVISDSLLEEVRHDIKALIDFKPSYNSLLALAGLKKAISSSKQIEKPVLLFSGL